MHASTVFALALASLAAAQSSTMSAPSSTESGGTSGCGTQIDDIINACLGTEQAQFNSCASDDWGCLCNQSGNIVTCYNNCPSDPNAYAAKQKQTLYCNAAAASPSSTSNHKAAAATSSMASSMATASSTPTSGSSSGSGSGASGSASGSAASPSSSSSAAMASLVAPAGGLVAALFGVVALI